MRLADKQRTRRENVTELQVKPFWNIHLFKRTAVIIFLKTLEKRLGLL